MIQKSLNDRPIVANSYITPHELNIDEVSAHLDVQVEKGLSTEQVTQRKKNYGPNQLQQESPRSAWLVFLVQFKSILILILIGAAFRRPYRQS